MTVAASPTEYSPPELPTRETYTPTHPGLFQVKFAEGDFASCLVTDRFFPAGEVLCPIVNIRPGHKAYSSVQVLPDPPISPEQDPSALRHIELNSDLLYVNHSCDPNVAFEVPKHGDWKVKALKNIEKGEVLTFAYFTTEWAMSQPFQCLCGSSKCIGYISGAQSMASSVLDQPSRYVINEHIKSLKAHQATGLSKLVSGKAAAANVDQNGQVDKTAHSETA